MDIYKEHGFETRREYLADLADNLGLDLSVVLPIAELLGESEDFDGLVNTLEDYSEGYF